MFCGPTTFSTHFQSNIGPSIICKNTWINLLNLKFSCGIKIATLISVSILSFASITALSLTVLIYINSTLILSTKTLLFLMNNHCCTTLKTFLTTPTTITRRKMLAFHMLTQIAPMITLPATFNTHVKSIWTCTKICYDARMNFVPCEEQENL